MRAQDYARLGNDMPHSRCEKLHFRLAEGSFPFASFMTTSANLFRSSNLALRSKLNHFDLFPSASLAFRI